MKKVFSIFLVVFLGTILLTLSGCEKEKSEFKVGICQLVQHSALDQATQGFIDGLKAEMEKNGKTVVFDNQNAQGDSNTCNTIVNKFVSSNVDLIMANATPALQSAANATLTIPVLGTSITEYGVALGIKNFSGTIGSNISGTSDLAPLDEQANMIKEVFPSAKNVGLLYCSAEANSLYQVEQMENFLGKLGFTTKRYSFADSNDISAVCTKCADESDVIYIPTDNTAASNAQLIDQICRPKKVPVVAGEGELCKVCGTISLSISYYNIGLKTGKMAAQILLGQAKIEEMAIAYDESPVKVYNKTICDELKISVPAGFVELK